MKALKKQELQKAFNDSSRHITLRGKGAVIPLKFDRSGLPVTEKTNLGDLILKRLTLLDIEFLYHWRLSEFKDYQKAAEKAGITPDHAERLVKKLACFKEEDARIKALCDVVTPSMVTAANAEGFYGDHFSDGQRDHLKELAKITGAYKTQASVTFTQNVFNLPKLSPEAEAKIKEIADREADVIEAEVSNG